MPSVIRLSASWQISQVIWMCVRNKVVLELIDLVFIIVIFVFIFIDFGFDIEELVSAFASALSSMTLMTQLVSSFGTARSPRQQQEVRGGNGSLHGPPLLHHPLHRLHHHRQQPGLNLPLRPQHPHHPRHPDPHLRQNLSACSSLVLK
jgi:hypothetical protein